MSKRVVRDRMVLRMRILGFLCGFTLMSSLLAIGHAAERVETFGIEELVLWIGGPLVALLIAALGIFIGGAYRQLAGKVDRVEADLTQLRIDIGSNYVRSDRWSELREWMERVEDKLDSKVDKT